MAQNQKKKTVSSARGKKPSARRSTQKNQKRNEDNALWSVTLFAAGVLILLLTMIKGESAWTAIHNFLLGIFGVTVFLVPPVLIYASVLIAMDKDSKTISGRIIQGTILIFLLSATVQILFVGDVRGVDWLDRLINLYDDGTLLKGGGIFSFVIGYPLLILFKKTGACIIIVLLTFVVIMLFLNKTIIDFFRLFSRPAKSIASAVNAAREDEFIPSPGAKMPPNEPMPPKNKRQDFDIDIAIPADKKANKKNAKNDYAVTATQVLDSQETSLPQHPVAAVKSDETAQKSPVNKPAKPDESPEKTEKRRKLEEKVKNASADLDAIVKKAAVQKAAAQNVPVQPSVSAAKASPVVINDLSAPEYTQDPVKVSDIEAEIVSKTMQENVRTYQIPPTTLLNAPKNTGVSADAEAEMKNNAETLVETLKSFGVTTRIVDIHRGPSVTRYELQPAAGVKVSKITGLSDDIALNLAAAGVRIEAPIPGKAAVGIEVPNKIKDTVTIRELLESDKFKDNKSKLSFVVGRDIEGNIITGDIAKMPHVIIAGTTGSGKSVCTNSIIMSILYNASPDEVRLVLIDPKMVEFKTYEGIPHLLIPVVTDPRKAAGALSWAVQEMLKRYKLFADNNVRDLKGYNEMANETDGVVPLPQIVIAIDELADLMMAASNEVEDAICRLAQMARAAGMHLIIATQRPTVDVITGLIKANIPSRIALTVSSQIDSRTIIDVAGAEKLLGSGDMLYYPQGIPKPVRVQGCFCSTKEVESVVDFIKNGGCKADYSDEIMAEIEKNIPVAKNDKGSSAASEGSDDNSGSDEMLDRAIEVIVESGQASTSYLQRRLKLGYSRAARIIDELEQMGVVGQFEGSKPRAVLITKEQWYERRMRNEVSGGQTTMLPADDTPAESVETDSNIEC